MTLHAPETTYLAWQDVTTLTGGRLVEFWKKACQGRSPEDPLRGKLAMALLADGRMAEAEGAYRDLLEIEDLPALRRGLARALLAQDRAEEALPYFEGADPDRDGTRVALEAAACRIQAGRPAAALPLLDALLARADLGSLERAHALGQKALAAAARGAFDEAFELVDRALELAPWDAILLTQRFSFLWQSEGPEAVARQVEPDRLLGRVRLSVPEGYGSTEEFNGALLEQVKNELGVFDVAGDPIARASLRLNDAIPRDSGPLGLLTHLLKEACEEYMPALAAAHPHPAAVEKFPLPVSLNGWCLMMQEEGRVERHLHPRGLMSGAYYVQVPVPEDPEDPAGCIEFGVEQAPGIFRRIRPEAGTAVLFPSFYSHATVPNRSQEERVVIAFDVIPA